MKLRKAIAGAFVLLGAVITMTGCAAASGEGGVGSASSMFSMLWIVVLLGIMYAVMIIPENKRKKKAQEMRNSIEVGDKITTIGGLVGKVVHVTNDTITFETGEDRVRIEVAKWAISANEGKGAGKETTSTDEKLDG